VTSQVVVAETEDVGQRSAMNGQCRHWNCRQLPPLESLCRVLGRPDASKVREFADEVRDGKFLLPIRGAHTGALLFYRHGGYLGRIEPKTAVVVKKFGLVEFRSRGWSFS
jgi:hypothetical protein